MKEQTRAPEKIQLSNEETANLSVAEFKTLVIRMLTDMVEYRHKIEEKVKAMKNELKENAQETNSEGKETGTQQFGAEGRNKHSTRTEWRNKNSKKEERFRNLQDNFKHSNIQIIGVTEEEEEQEIENLFENIMKENYPNVAKEIDFQEVQEAQTVPKKLDVRKYTARYTIIALPKIKDEERILKAAREKETITYKAVPMRLSADFSKETLQARRGWKEVF